MPKSLKMVLLDLRKKLQHDTPTKKNTRLLSAKVMKFQVCPNAPLERALAL